MRSGSVTRPASARSCPKGTLTFLASPGTLGACRSAAADGVGRVGRAPCAGSRVGPLREPAARVVGARLRPVTGRDRSGVHRRSERRTVTDLDRAADGASPPRELLRGGNGNQVSFGANGELLYRFVDENASFLYRITRDGSHRERITDTPILEKMGSSPDGGWVTANVPAAGASGTGARGRFRPWLSRCRAARAGRSVRSTARRSGRPTAGSFESHCGLDKPRPLAPPTCSFRCRPDYRCQTCPMEESRQSTTP